MTTDASSALSTGVVTRDPSVRDDERGSRALVIAESIDTELIAQELEGRAVSAWAYRFAEGDNQVTGLTVAGVEQCSRESAKQGEALRILGEPKWQWIEQDASWFAVVTVGRYAVRVNGDSILLDTAIGTKQERARKWSRRGRKYYEDPQALDKAISKAARNAKRKLLDPQLQERVLHAALAAGKVVSVDAQRQRTAVVEAERDALPPPPREKVEEDGARRSFYAAARELGLESQSAIHARLRDVVGLVCPEGVVHDVGTNDPDACHALREAVNRYADAHVTTTASAWEYLAEQLGAEVEEFGEAEIGYE